MRSLLRQARHRAADLGGSFVHICASQTIDDLRGLIRFGGLGRTRGRSVMGHAQEPYDELDELRQENKQLRETVAHLAQVVLTQIAGAAKPKAQPASAED